MEEVKGVDPEKISKALQKRLDDSGVKYSFVYIKTCGAIMYDNYASQKGGPCCCVEEHEGSFFNNLLSNINYFAAIMFEPQ